ncbi:pyrophosphate--fructose-6-phosphate 1-phosphotransferase [Arsenicicoccus dermatophilus]|uniref:pyrophosphate--fructose-6-phosphate 1-phosphotransferase n=1 Tax=Arsenicicoccus dermatophilus TaxID=1076331 RepID=UPI001F4C6445|nr:pyrophosphate--fructose-6-phosphate 1-phosphotransferase [Arsenicicoccus dermatophilus]MCH8613808.1 pyrophosphate--fructose-6-phosphate 1-phosphotransferase [Arsenicicoccus dermatophilus]
MTIKRVAMLTAGGYAPCLSAAVGDLIERYTEVMPEVELIGYRHGYHGVLTGTYTVFDEETRRNAGLLRDFGGSPIGNSRVKLTNAKDLVARGLVKEGDNPLEVAANRLKEDGVDVLHTIGGDDTNTTAADLAAFLHEQGYELTVVGLPKTIDNDIVPIRQSLGAQTAAEQASIFAQNVIAEHGSNPRMLIVHEVMGRNCGWLTAAAAKHYMEWHGQQQWLPQAGLTPERWAIHGVYVPEVHVDLDREAERLKKVMDEIGNVNIFLSEGAGVDDIVTAMEAAGEEVQRDPFGHVKLDTINPGSYFASQFADKLQAEKKMVQKSGYFSRSAKANDTDLALIKQMCDVAVEAARAGTPGVVGHDEERGDELRVIEFPRIAGHKAFDASQPWFQELLRQIGQEA